MSTPAVDSGFDGPTIDELCSKILLTGERRRAGESAVADHLQAIFDARAVTVGDLMKFTGRPSQQVRRRLVRPGRWSITDIVHIGDGLDMDGMTFTRGVLEALASAVDGWKPESHA